MPDAAFRVLVVCTANLCRSPMAEFLLRARLPATMSWEVLSAGTQAASGSFMHPLAAAVLRERGHEIDGFRTTQLDAALIARMDLVLTAERAHRAQVVQLHPAAVRRTFTLRQFVRLLSGGRAPSSRPADEDPGRWLIAQAHANLTGVGPRQQRAEDVEDPMGSKIRTFRRCADLLDQVATAIAAPLT